MATLNSLCLPEDELGCVLRSGITGESLYYRARWDELCAEACQAAREQGRPEPADVRRADYALELLGIPCQWSESDMDETGEWFVYWR